MATVTEPRAQVRNMTNEQYHADKSAVGKSGLWTFAKRKRLYEAEYILGTAPQREATDAMELGTLAHAAILEPDRLADMYATMPASLLSADGGIRTNAAKAHRDELEAAGKIVLKPQQYDAICAIVESAYRQLGDWLKYPSEREQSIFWTNEETGLRCKCRPDWRITPATGGTVYVPDLKITNDASPHAFDRRAEELGYFLQDPHYSEGVELLTGKTVEFLFVVIESKYPHACNVRQLKPEDRARSQAYRINLLADLAERSITGDWREPWETEVVDINLRQFVFQS